MSLLKFSAKVLQQSVIFVSHYIFFCFFIFVCKITIFSYICKFIFLFVRATTSQMVQLCFGCVVAVLWGKGLADRWQTLSRGLCNIGLSSPYHHLIRTLSAPLKRMPKFKLQRTCTEIYCFHAAKVLHQSVILVSHVCFYSQM